MVSWYIKQEIGKVESNKIMMENNIFLLVTDRLNRQIIYSVVKFWIGKEHTCSDLTSHLAISEDIIFWGTWYILKTVCSGT